MNILMIHPHDLYSHLEPWTVRIKKIAAELIKNNHHVKLVYFPLDSNDAYREFSDEKIEVIALSRRHGFSVMIKNILYVFKIAGKADVIHLQKCYYYAALPALIAAFLRNKPLHYDWDDFETKIFYYSNPKQRIIGEFLNIYEKLIPKVADTISVSSLYLRNLSISRGASPGHIFAAPVGADLEMFNPENVNKYKGRIKAKFGIRSSIVLYIGQLHGGQYAELFIKASSIILESRRDVFFMIVGDGYRAHELKELTRHLGVAEHFIFTGFISHGEIPKYLSDADVCVACFEENEITKCKSPLKIVEYLASGKAIVASNVGEVRSMVGGVGMLTQAGDAGSLASGIMILLGDEKLRSALGNGAVMRARKKYNWSVTSGNILKAYNTAICLK